MRFRAVSEDQEARSERALPGRKPGCDPNIDCSFSTRAAPVFIICSSSGKGMFLCLEIPLILVGEVTGIALLYELSYLSLQIWRLKQRADVLRFLKYFRLSSHGCELGINKLVCMHGKE